MITPSQLPDSLSSDLRETPSTEPRRCIDVNHVVNTERTLCCECGKFIMHTDQPVETPASSTELRDAIMRDVCELSPAAQVDDEELIVCTYEQLSHIITSHLGETPASSTEHETKNVLRATTNRALHGR